MGIQRPRAPDKGNPMSSIHASRRAQVSGGIQKKKAHVPPPSFSSSSISHLKKKIRDISRLLLHTTNSETMTANIRQDNERALAGYRVELALAEEEAQRRSMEARYKMVKFFERQKATRRLKKLKKTVDAAPANELLKEQAHIAEVDLNYTLHYPLDRKYVSLYPDHAKKEDEGKEADEKERRDAQEMVTREKGNAEVWREIERRMKVGGLDEPWGKTGLSKAMVGMTIHEKQGTKGEKASGKGSTKKEDEMDVDLDKVDGSESEDGFFEE